MSSAQPTQPSGSGRAKRLGIIGALGIVVAILIGMFAIWFVFFSSEAPEAPTIEGAAAALEASPTSTDGDATEGDATSTEVPTVSEDPVATEPPAGQDGTDGTWSIDTSIGDFADATSSFVGFRVAEVLDPIGETVAIGRTPAVSGQLELEGLTLASAVIEADLTQISSDRSRRDRPIQRALQTGQFPTALFESSGPVELSAIREADETIEVAIPGTLTIHGVTQDVEVDMEVRLIDGVVLVVGSMPIDFTSYGITMPTARIVVSVEDSGDLEWQLFFTREG